MKIVINDTWNKGMGTELCAYSVFAELPVEEITVNSQRLLDVFRNYNEIFKLDIPIIYQSHNEIGLIPNDVFKMFSPYFVKKRPDKTRPYIGLACYDNNKRVNNLNEQEWNYKKLYTIDHYQQIFKFIKSLGYDVITFDNKDIGKKQKSELIENLCECVIGYEGGIAHLCHMLDTPFFMLPWHEHNKVLLPNNNYYNIEHIFHLDRKTFFFEDIQQLHNISQTDFMGLLDLLKNNKGNNQLLNSEVLENFDFKSCFTELTEVIQFDDTEKEFLSLAYDKFLIGGIK